MLAFLPGIEGCWGTGSCFALAKPGGLLGFLGFFLQLTISQVATLTSASR